MGAHLQRPRAASSSPFHRWGAWLLSGQAHIVGEVAQTEGSVFLLPGAPLCPWGTPLSLASVGRLDGDWWVGLHSGCSCGEAGLLASAGAPPPSC